jgi:hypothetical protein
MLNLFTVPDLDRWTAVAWRDRQARGRWRRCSDAPLSLQEAKRLRDQGALEQALAFTAETETVMVRRRVRTIRHFPASVSAVRATP